jgi:hypothetical protein
MAKSALQKLNAVQEARIVRKLPPRVAHWGPPGASMVISTPREIEEVTLSIRKGKLMTLNGLRQVIAKRHQTTITCPVTTGIFLGIVAKAMAEREMMGVKKVAPWWRIVKTDGSLNDKMPGGLAEHRRRLEAEGFKVVRNGKNGMMVEGFEEKISTG